MKDWLIAFLDEHPWLKIAMVALGMLLVFWCIGHVLRADAPLPGEIEMSVTPRIRVKPEKVSWTPDGRLVYDGRLVVLYVCPEDKPSEKCWKVYYQIAGAK